MILEVTVAMVPQGATFLVAQIGKWIKQVAVLGKQAARSRKIEKQPLLRDVNTCEVSSTSEQRCNPTEY